MKAIWFLTFAVIAMAALAAPARASDYIVTVGSHDAVRSIPWWGDAEGYVGMRFQCLWLQSEINHAGYINVVEFDVARQISHGQDKHTFYNVRVWLCHTKKAGLENTYDNNYTGFTPVQVLNVDQLIIRSNVGYVDIGITPNLFSYNNADNLLMEVRWHTGYTGVQCWQFKRTDGLVFARRDNAASGTDLDMSQCIRLHIGTLTGVEPASFGKVKALLR